MSTQPHLLIVRQVSAWRSTAELIIIAGLSLLIVLVIVGLLFMISINALEVG